MNQVILTPNLIHPEKWILQLQTLFWVQRSQISGPTWYVEMIDFWRRIDFRKNIWYTSLSHWWGLEIGNFLKSTKLQILIMSQIVNILGWRDMWPEVTWFEPIWSVHHKTIDYGSILDILSRHQYRQFSKIPKFRHTPPLFVDGARIVQKSSILIFSSRFSSFKEIYEDWFLNFFHFFDVPKLADFRHIKFRDCQILSEFLLKFKILQNGLETLKK